jgi:hypothetical protein
MLQKYRKSATVLSFGQLKEIKGGQQTQDNFLMPQCITDEQCVSTCMPDGSGSYGRCNLSGKCRPTTCP